MVCSPVYSAFFIISTSTAAKSLPQEVCISSSTVVAVAAAPALAWSCWLCLCMLFFSWQREDSNSPL